MVERRKDDKWVPASAAAAKAIHEKSQSACAIAARILPTCGSGKPDKTRLPPPTEFEKQAMRSLLGL